MQQENPKVLITKKFPNEIIQPLQKIACVYQWDQNVYDLMPRTEVLKMIGEMTAVINQAELTVDEEVLKEGKQLKIIANVSLGYDNLDLPLMKKYRVWASNTPGFFGHPVVEYIIGGMIAILRKLSEADRFVRNGDWYSFQPGRWDGEGLADKTLGIIGMGNIGKSLAEKAVCLGMKVIYYSRSESIEVYPRMSLLEVFSEADIISVNVPYASDTHEMIDTDCFRRMRSGALFINTSRGKVVKEADLVHFLKMGHLGGAILDVFENEPLVPDILKTMPNVLLTPHIAGGTIAARMACYRLAVKNIMEVIKGRVPITPLNKIS